jgi:hypothetical protein
VLTVQRVLVHQRRYQLVVLKLPVAAHLLFLRLAAVHLIVVAAPVQRQVQLLLLVDLLMVAAVVAAAVDQ